MGLSTAFSDFVLAVSSFYPAYLTQGHPYQSCYGLLVIGIAASLGVYRFGARHPSDDFIDAHKLFSWLGSVMGMPLIAAGLLKRNGHHMFVLPYTIAPLAFLFLYKTLPNDLKNLGNSTLSTVAVLSIAVSSILVQNYHGIYSAIAIILAATVIGTDGKILGVPNVDIFHYVLAIGNMFYCWSLN